jgi:hypothetical protein
MQINKRGYNNWSHWFIAVISEIKWLIWFQMLNYCMERRREREKRARMPADAQHSSDNGTASAFSLILYAICLYINYSIHVYVIDYR